MDSALIQSAGGGNAFYSTPSSVADDDEKKDSSGSKRQRVHFSSVHAVESLVRFLDTPFLLWDTQLHRVSPTKAKGEWKSSRLIGEHG